MTDAITDPTVVTVPAPSASESPEAASPQGGGAVTEKASQVATSATESGTQVAQHAVDQAKTVTAETQRQARNLVGEAQNQVREQAQTQQQRASTGLHSLADQLGAMAEHGDESSPATDLARQASERAHGVANWLEQRQPGDLIEEVRRFARQRPGTFLLAAAAAGVLAGRLTRGVVAAQSDEKSEPTSAESGTPSGEGFVADTPGPLSSSAEFGYPTAAGTSYPPAPTQPSSAGTTTYGAPNPYGANPSSPYGSNPETQGQP
jgi:hypothetical protein